MKNQKTLLIIGTASAIVSLSYYLYAQHAFLFAPTLIVFSLCALVMEHFLNKAHNNKTKALLIILITALIFLSFSWYIGFSNLSLLLSNTNNILICIALINSTILILSQLTSAKFTKKIYKNIINSFKYVLISLFAGISTLHKKDILKVTIFCFIILSIIFAILYISPELYFIYTISTIDGMYILFTLFQNMHSFFYFFINIIITISPYVSMTIAIIFSLGLIVNNLTQTYKRLSSNTFNFSAKFIIASFISIFLIVVLFKLNFSTLTIAHVINTVIACLCSAPTILSIIGAWLLINVYKCFYEINNMDLIDEKILISAKQTLAFLFSIIDSVVFNIPSILLFGKDTIIKNKLINNYNAPSAIKKFFLEISPSPFIKQGLVFDYNLQRGLKNARHNYPAYNWDDQLKKLEEGYDNNIELKLKSQTNYTCPILLEGIVQDGKQVDDETISHLNTFLLIDKNGNIILIEKESYVNMQQSALEDKGYSLINYIPSNPSTRQAIIFQANTTTALFDLITQDQELSLKDILTIIEREKSSTKKTNFYTKFLFITGLIIGIIISELFALNLILTTLSTAILTSTLTSMIGKGSFKRQFSKFVFKPLLFSIVIDLFLFFILTTNPFLASLITSKGLMITTMLAISSISLTLSKNLICFDNKSFSENLKYAVWNNRLKPMLKQIYNLLYTICINLIINTITYAVMIIFSTLILTAFIAYFLLVLVGSGAVSLLSAALMMLWYSLYYLAIPLLAIIYILEKSSNYETIFNILLKYFDFLHDNVSIQIETIAISFICLISIASYMISPANSFNILQNLYLCFANPLILTVIIIMSLVLSLCIENYKNNTSNDSIIEKLITSITNTLDLLLCTISCPILMLTPMFLQQTLFYMICAIRSLLFGSKTHEIWNKDLTTETNILNDITSDPVLNSFKESHDDLTQMFALNETSIDNNIV